MDSTTPYSEWNEFRTLFTDMYRDPAKVIMKDFHLIYPELMDVIKFPEFSKDYMEVSNPVVLIKDSSFSLFSFFIICFCRFCY